MPPFIVFLHMLPVRRIAPSPSPFVQVCEAPSPRFTYWKKNFRFNFFAHMRAFMAYHIVDNASFIDYICVKRQHRRSGLGSALLANISTPAHLIVSALRVASSLQR